MTAPSILALSGIYAIRNTVNGKVYIGSAVKFSKRFNTHRSRLKKGAHHSKKLQASWNKHGEAVFVFEVLEIVESAVDLIKNEQKWIDHCNSYYAGYNSVIVAGNTLGFKFTEETKKKISLSAMGRKMSDSTKAILYAVNLGRKHSKESIKKMSDAAKRTIRKPMTDEHKRKIGDATRCRVVSEETRIKISNSKKGKPLDDSRKAKLLASHLGVPLSDETKKKLSIAGKGRKCPEHVKKTLSLAKKGVARDPEIMARGAATKKANKLLRQSL